MNIRSLKNISLVSIGNVINAGLSFLFIAILARTLNLEDFGKYALVTSILLGAAKATDFGTNYLFVAQSITKDSNLISKYTSSRLIFLALSVLISTLVLYFLEIRGISVYVAFVLGIIGYFFVYLVQAIYQKNQNFIGVVSLTFIPSLVKFVAGLFILLNLWIPNLNSVLLLYCLSIVPSALFIFTVSKEFTNLKLDFTDFWKLTKLTAPAGVAQLTHESWSGISNTLLNIFKGFSDVAVYSVADKVSGVIPLFSYSLFTVVLPKNAHDKKIYKKYNYKEAGLFSLIMVTATVVGIIIAQFFIPLVFGEVYKASLKVFDVMLVASALTGIHMYIENFLYIEAETNKILKIYVSKLFCLVLFSALLIPSFGMIGLSYAQLIASSVALGVTVLGVRSFSSKSNV